jgi:hypothetical protein
LRQVRNHLLENASESVSNKRKDKSKKKTVGAHM